MCLHAVVRADAQKVHTRCTSLRRDGNGMRARRKEAVMALTYSASEDVMKMQTDIHRSRQGKVRCDAAPGYRRLRIERLQSDVGGPGGCSVHAREYLGHGDSEITGGGFCTQLHYSPLRGPVSDTMSIDVRDRIREPEAQDSRHVGAYCDPQLMTFEGKDDIRGFRNREQFCVTEAEHTGVLKYPQR